MTEKAFSIRHFSVLIFQWKASNAEAQRHGDSEKDSTCFVLV